MNGKLFSIATVILATVCLISAAGDQEQIIFRADSMSGIAGSKSDTTRLTGNAYVKTGAMEITADSIQMSGENFRFITAEGNVTATNQETEMDFTCGKLKYDRQTKTASLENSVHLIDRRNSVTADAQIVEYNQNTETAVLQIDITLKQENNVCTGAYAIYRKKNQILELTGNPKIIQGTDMFRAQEISLNLTSQEILLDGRVTGTVTNTKKGGPGEKDKQENDAEQEYGGPDKNTRGNGTGDPDGPQ